MAHYYQFLKIKYHFVTNLEMIHIRDSWTILLPKTKIVIHTLLTSARQKLDIK